MHTKKISFSISVIIYSIFYFLLWKFLPAQYIPAGKYIMGFIGLGSALGILYLTYRKNSYMKRYYLALLLTGIFCFLGEILGFGIYLSGNTPSLIWSVPFSILSNLSLAFGIYFLMESSLKKWDGIKIFLDGFILGLMLFYVAWAMIYSNIVTYLLFDNFQDAEKLYFLFCLVINFLMFFGLTIFYLFDRNYLKDKNNILEVSGFLFWFAGNLALLYIQLYQNYQNIYLISFLWIIALLLLALSTLTPKKELNSISTAEELGFYQNKNIVFNALIIFLGIVLFIMAPVTFLVILPILIFRQMFSKYIKLSRYNVILIENANLDPLTKLFNRKKFTEEMELLFKGLKNDERGTLAIIEINRFKYINSFYGYLIGDKILMDMGERIKKHMEVRELSGRWNGDEFIVYMRDTENRERAYSKCQEIIDLLREPFQYENVVVNCSLNIGAALVPEDATDLNELIKCADSSLIKSIHEGKNKIVFYEKGIGLEKEYREL